MKSFVKQFVAIVTGDDAEAQAQKALRQANSALKTQIASLEGDTISLEDRVDTAKENQALSRVNRGQQIVDRTVYIRNLLNAKNEVTAAEDSLKLHLDKISFLKAELASLDDDAVEITSAQ